MKSRLLLILLASIYLGCSENTDVNPSRSASDGVANPIGANQCYSPVTRLIDMGERATTGATMGLRGAFSDVAQVPGTNYPATVYTDSGAVTLKYTFWTGTIFRTEIIAGGLTTQFVRLVFLPTGKPVVFWSNGATAVYMAVRSTASLNETGTWTVTAIDNVATMATRSLEASVSNTGQVGVLYINATNTSARIVLCNANCDSAANYTGMGVVTNFINGTASATANSADIKWCAASSTVNYPYVTFPGSANSLIGRCTQSTLANCLTPGNWSTASVTDGVNATGANQIFSKMHIGSTTDAPFAVVAKRLTGTEIRAYAQNAGGCATGALAFSATSRSIASGATLGTAYASLARDAGNRWHLVTNDSNTSMRYYNETTGTITAAWNALSTIETTTIGAAGATRGGMAIDESGSQVIVTYGRTAGGTPALTLGNMVLAYNDCPVGGTGCGASTLASSSAAAGMSWGNEPPDSTGQILLTTAQIPQTVSAAATARGIPAAAYVDFSVGSATTGRLKYALRSGYAATDSWASYDIPTAQSPQSVALAFDQADRPWIAYYDASSLRYYLTTNNMSDGSGNWVTYQYPIAAATAATLPAVNNVGLAMYFVNGVAKPMMFVSNSGAATKVVRAAIFNPGTENWVNNTQLDTGVANFSFMSSDFNKSGLIVFAYYDTTNNTVKYTSTSDGGTTWGTSTAVISASGGMGLQIRLNPVNNRPTMSFFDRSINFVRVKACLTAAATCTTVANWDNLGLGVVDFTTGVSGLTAAATDGLLATALTYTSTGQAWVSFPRGAGATSADLMQAYVNEVSGVFNLGTVLSASSNAAVTTPVAATPANFGAGGWMPSSVRTANGSLHTIYVGPGNFLQVTSCGD